MKPNRAKATGFRGATRSTFRYSTSALSYWPDLKSLLARARYRFFRISLVQPVPLSAINTATSNPAPYRHSILIFILFLLRLGGPALSRPACAKYTKAQKKAPVLSERKAGRRGGAGLNSSYPGRHGCKVRQC